MIMYDRVIHFSEIVVYANKIETADKNRFKFSFTANKMDL